MVLDEDMLALISSECSLNNQDAYIMGREACLHAFSLCVLCASGTVHLSHAEISDSLSYCFQGLLALAKAGRLQDAGIEPQKG